MTSLPLPAGTNRSASKPPSRSSALALAAALAAGVAHAQQNLEPVTVTGNRVQTQVFDAPYAIGVVGADELRGAGPMVNLSEALSRVPGLTVVNRSNYAQDLQISSRGFGARASFGVRGLRLYTDGIPASTPDGAGQVTHFDLAGAERVEVLRGPFSALYGNSSGGVIALFSAPAKQPRVEFGFDAGSFGQRQLRGYVGAPVGDTWDAQAQLSHFEIDGFRPHSAAERQLMNFRLGRAGERDDITLILNSLDQPADDPLGLDRGQFDADPYQTTPQAFDFDTRKVAQQTQLGANWRHRFGDGVLVASEATAYFGERSVIQWQAIPTTTQRNPNPGPPFTARHPGGVIDFDRDYQGVDARLVWRLGSRGSLVTGVNVERQEEDRRGFENFTGDPANPDARGVTGALRRDEVNTVRSSDLYAQGEVELLQALTLGAGVRSGKIRFSSDDAYVVPPNGDDSGSRSFSYTNPVLSVRWRVGDSLNLYASAGRGFESPNLNELAYNADTTQAGFNRALQPQKSRQVEIGAKWRGLQGRVAVDVALFDARTENEIGVLTNAGGRSAFQNVGDTTRRGAEAQVRWQVAPRWSALAAATLLDAKYDDAFTTCIGVPCNAANPQNIGTVAAGNRIAGTSRGFGYAELAWKPGERTELGVEVRAQGGIVVNDRNTDHAERYTVLNLRARQRYDLGSGLTLELLARVDNLTDKVYAGTVIVNEGNGRFFEAGPPRAYSLGVRLAQKF
jgi:iron complex outermembrane receptor protein